MQELENLAERALIQAKANASDRRSFDAPFPGLSASKLSIPEKPDTEIPSLENVTADHIVRTLRKTGGRPREKTGQPPC